MNDQIRKKALRTTALSRFAKFLDKFAPNTDWTTAARAHGMEELLDDARHERVRRAQYFGDEDYSQAVARFIQDVFDTDESVGIMMLSHIVAEQSQLPEEAQNELKQISQMLSGENPNSAASNLFDIAMMGSVDFLQISDFPDDFYKKLIAEINAAHRNGMMISLSILVRKLFENLIIDILRKKYGTTELDLYYDKNKRRFHDFSVVLKNLDVKKTDFHHITDNIDKVLKDINEYRETGNAGAHSIDAQVTTDYFKNRLDQITYAVQLLVRVYKNL